MNKALNDCANCNRPVITERRNYRYTESGLSNVILQDVEVAECAICGHSEVTIPRLAKVHNTIALALVNSPVRLGGSQLRFLRKHIGYSGSELAKYLHTDKTKISKWERGEDTIGPSNDRLVRLLVAAFDPELSSHVASIAAHLSEISDEADKDWELHIDVEHLTFAFLSALKAA